MRVSEITFLTPEQKRNLISVGVNEINGDNIINLKDFVTYGEAVKSQRLSMYLMYMGIGCREVTLGGVAYLSVLNKSQIAANMQLKAKEEKKIIDTAKKIQQGAADRWKAIQEEAASIQIDVIFVNHVAGRCAYMGSGFYPTTNDHILLNHCNQLLRRNKIKQIKTSEKDVFELLLKKVQDNWLFRSLTNQ